MHQQSQELVANRLSNYISLVSPKFRSLKNPIISSLERFSTLQQNRFDQIQKGCKFLENYLTSIQQMLEKLEERSRQIQETRSAQTIFNLKQKQNQFIIHQLKDKIKKYQKNQQNLQIELKHLKKQLENLKRIDKQKERDRNNETNKFKLQLSSIEKIINEKENLINELNQQIELMKCDKKSLKQLENVENKQRQKQKQFKSLENKLFELQSDFDKKLASFQKQVLEKDNKIRELEAEIIKKQKEWSQKQKDYQLQLNDNDRLPTFNYAGNSSHLIETFNPKTAEQSLNLKQPQQKSQTQKSVSESSTYELQLKLMHQQTLYQELEQQYTSHMAQTNNLEIQLHQQIHQTKLQLQEQKKKAKSDKKKITRLLQSLASSINNRNFNNLDGVKQIDNLVEQVKKIFMRQKQKWQNELAESKKLEEQKQEKIIEVERQNRKFKSEILLLKQETENLKEQISRLLTQKQKKSKRQEPSQLSDFNAKQKSLNGSLGSISNSKSEPKSLLEEKYRVNIQSLKSQIQQKEQHISQLQALQSVDFEKSKEKILTIESELADSRNEQKKLERELREAKEKYSQCCRQINSLRITFQQSKQKFAKQKQSMVAQQQIKIKSLQQKLSKLKQLNQQIDSKGQDKILRYNKLKSKLEKLEMYNNEMQKRKDMQIQELINKNQQTKMECKLLEEKINLGELLAEQQTNFGSGDFDSSSKTPHAYNKDLIEQIQMQRDRILEQYQNKRRDCIKTKETNQKLDQNNNKLKQSLKKYEQQKAKLQQENQKLNEQKVKLTLQIQRNMNKFLQQKASLASQVAQLKKEIACQKLIKQQLSTKLVNVQEEIFKKSKVESQNLRKELETHLQFKKKIQKEQSALVQRIKQLKEENQKLKKEIQQKAKSLEVRWQEKYKQKTNLHQQELAKLKQQILTKSTEYQQKLSEAQKRQENLVSIINYKNRQKNGEMRESMKGEEYQAFQNFNQHREGQFKEKFANLCTEQETNTEQRNLCIIKATPIQLFTVVNVPSFAIQSCVSSLMICSDIQYEHNEAFANIFEEERQLFLYISKSYPQVLKYFYSLLSTQNQFSKIPTNQPRQKEIQQVCINLANPLLEQQNINILSSKTIDNQQKPPVKQFSFILQKSLQGSCKHSSGEHAGDFLSKTENNNMLQQNLKNQEIKFKNAYILDTLKPSNFNIELGEEQNIDDNFQICSQGESINVGRTALNLQIKEIFNKLREQLQKVFNGEQISLSMIKILPRQLQDDYNDFIAYVRQKISEIKSQNQLSFIMAEVGDEITALDEELDHQLKIFVEKKTLEDVFTYKKLVQQKQALITSLMNERTMQQNTINQMTVQKQQLDEEHQNRFMNQCNIYKKEIKQLKRKLDSLEMAFQSLKNVFKNTMQIWVDDTQNQDDLRDNFQIYKSVAKINELESTRINYYIFKYKQIKNIQD